MWKINCLIFFSLIIGSLAEDNPPLSENACEITGFSIFHKKPRESTPLNSVYSPLDRMNISRVFLFDYPQGRINIKTNVDSLPGCERPGCVMTKLEPNYFYYKDRTAVSNQNVAPYLLYNVNKPQKQHAAYHLLTARAFQTSDCSGTPYSNATVGVSIELEKTTKFTYPPTIVVYEGTSSPVTDADTMVFGTATCNFLRDALRNGFIFNRGFSREGVSDTSVKAFDCDFNLLASGSGGPLQIEFQLDVSFELARDPNLDPFLGRRLPGFDESWTAIMNYFLDMPVRTVGTTEEVMSTRVKSEIASSSPYQQYTNAILSVEPYTKDFKVVLVSSYIGTGGVPVTASHRAILANATCAFIIANLPFVFHDEGVALTETQCKLKSHVSNGTPLQVTYEVDVKVTIGPSLDPDNTYLDKYDGVEYIADYIQYMYEDSFDSITDSDDPQMSTLVKIAIGPNSPYYNYQELTFQSILPY